MLFVTFLLDFVDEVVCFVTNCHCVCVFIIADVECCMLSAAAAGLTTGARKDS